MSVCSDSWERSREYSSAIVSEASLVSVGLMALAMWMYLRMNLRLTILSLLVKKGNTVSKEEKTAQRQHFNIYYMNRLHQLPQ